MSDIFNNDKGDINSTTSVSDYAQTQEAEELSVAANYRWRVADIALGSALAAVFGVILCGYGLVFIPIIRTLNAAVLPGFASITHGVWYLSGTLAVLLIRKPGSAVYVNVVAALIQVLLGSPFSFTGTVISALMQGVFAEIPFLIFRLRKFNLTLSIVSGVLVALEYGVFLTFTKYQAKAPSYITVHMITELISGFLLSGVLVWFVYLALRATGALDNFSSGRSDRA
ncbi:ABC transporter [Gardnerella vaginalis]|uniref:ABC transporter n=1 Tax=Gardnerella vaginalis TaxID=2702 RepID=A0A3E1J004_GARVA|nr:MULTISPECIES: ECF transporter S component [Gardnerella]RFD79664.1 ABC transporter [Gardnerella vaginalis]